MSLSDSRHLVDPELLPLLELFPNRPLSDETLGAMRERVYPIPNDPEIAAKVVEQRIAIPGPPGAPEVEVLCYRPKAAAGALPAILHIHGGGYVAGSAAGLAAAHRSLVHDLNCALVSVEYRLAPETRFPGAVEDCYAALAWLNAHPDRAGVDPGRIGVMGESAGGGLAAALALLARDRGDYRLAFQHLIYPMIDDRTAALAEGDRHPYAGEFLWTAVNNRYGWSALLGHPPGQDGVSPYAAAARAEDLSGLPPTFLSTGSLDLFLEEDIDYARRLLRAGVPTELHVYPGGFHAFDLAPTAAVSRQARRDSKAALQRFLHG